MSLREAEVQVGWKTVAAGELVERLVRRVHHVAEVERPALFDVACTERQLGEEAALRLAHPGLSALHGQTLLRETQVVPQRLRDDGVQLRGRLCGPRSCGERRDECGETESS